MRMLSASLLSFAVLLPAAASADILAPSSGQSYYQIGLIFDDFQDMLTPTPHFIYYHSSSPVGAVGAFFTGGSDPAVGSFVGSSGAAVPYGEQASSNAYYEFQVLGPAGRTVGVTVAGTISGSVSNLTANSTAYADLTIVRPSDPASPDDGYAFTTLLYKATCAGPLANISTCGIGYTVPTQSSMANVDQVIQVLTNTAYVVELHSGTSISGAIYGGAVSNVDPTITLDTNDPGYTLDFSPGLLAPTPEPSTLALACTGLLSAASAFRRRRTCQ